VPFKNRQAHRETVLEIDKRYRQRKRVGNPEYLAQARARNSEYYKKNKEELALKRRLRKAMKRQAERELLALPPSHVTSTWIDILNVRLKKT